jgi:serine/threonine protein kinase
LRDEAPPTCALRLADHDLVREIGRGGMGVVYLARQRMLDRLEVLKVMNESLVRDSEAAERFLREIRAAARLHHPNIVTAYSAALIDRTLAFAMEYVEGIDLAKLMAMRGPLPISEACYYAREAAIGLQHAFEQGMVHRDIKPSNLIVSSKGARVFLKILDFGLAKATREAIAGSGLTQAGQFLGTLEYMSPEQATDASTADIRSDIYSLGCTLYFLLTGSPPFRGSLLEVLRAHECTPVAPAHLVRGDIPHEVDVILSQMLEKNAEQRFATPQEVADALSPFAFMPDSIAISSFVLQPSPAARIDTQSRAQDLTLAVRNQKNRQGLLEIDAPWAVRWFPAYCLLAAAINIFLVICFPIYLVLELNYELPNTPPLTKQQEMETILGLAMICIPCLIGAIVFSYGLTLKRRPTTWAIGMTLIVGGICFVVPCPLSLALAYYWLKEDTRRYFERSSVVN